MPPIGDILKEIPKSELHVHLRGAMPPGVLAELWRRFPLRIEDVPERYRAVFEKCENIRPFLDGRPRGHEEAAALFQFRDFDHFLTTYLFTSFFVRDAAALDSLIAGVIGELRAQNVVYAEITISAGEYINRGISAEDIGGCLDRAATFPGPKVRWIVDLVRNFGSEGCMALLRKILAVGCEHIVGITLGGSEHLFPPGQFAGIYDLARDNGLRLSVHAGEALGPESVWDALRLLKVERIGHGVRAVEDPALVRHLAGHGVALEVCPTSNLRTGIYPSYHAHPIKSLFEAGVPITVNTDDPTFFQTSLVDEYLHLHDLGIPGEALFAMIENGFRYAFIAQEEKESYLRNLQRYRPLLAGIG